MPVGTIDEYNVAEHQAKIRALAKLEMERRRIERDGPQINIF
jgi:hypothetical protein